MMLAVIFVSYAIYLIFSNVERDNSFQIMFKETIAGRPCIYFNPISYISKIACLKADFQSVEFSEWAEILFFARENVALKLNR